MNRLKRFTVTVLVSLSLLLARPAEASVPMARADASTSWTSTGSTIAYAIASADTIRVQVWSSAGSVATVTIDVRSSGTAPWYTVATISNPSTSGEYWSIPRSIDVRVNVSAYTSGTISANLEAYRGQARVF